MDRKYMENISDDIIEKAAGGDQEAFELIYRSSSKFVYNVSWRIVDKHEDAQEVTQEVFLIIYRKLSTFRFQSTLKTWIYRVTINTAMNYVKKLSRAKNKTTEYNEQIHCAGVLGEVEASVDKEHNEKLVSVLLDTLTSDQRACMVLRNIEGLSYQEIADVLSININTVRSRLSRGRKTLLQLRKEVIKNEV